ncbi:MAG: aldo/keto reductase [Candidatus Pristimantibacillus sp.]
MDTITLGKTKQLVSKIGLGTVQFGMDYGFTQKKTQQQVDEILSCANVNGVKLIDTAREYGDSEEKIGTFISQNSNSFVVATKLEKIPIELALDPKSIRERVYRSIEASLENLKLDKLSLLQLHQTDHYLINNNFFWEIINELKSEHVIDGFGVSVYDEAETEYLIANYNSLIDFFQVPYNVFDRRFDKLEAQLGEYSIGLISRSTFLKGIIPCSLDDLPIALGGLKEFKIKLSHLAQKLSMKVEELALLFVYYNQSIQSTIIGVDTVAELIENINLINQYERDPFGNINFNDLSVDDVCLIDPRKWTDF